MYLMENLDPDAISNKLVEEELFTQDEFDELVTQGVRKRKIEFLLAKLPLKGPTAFNRFLSVLQNTPGQEFVAEQLQPRDAGMCVCVYCLLKHLILLILKAIAACEHTWHVHALVPYSL